MFRFDNYASDLTPATDWKPGDPWEQHFTQPGLDDRDTQLEDYLSAFERAVAARSLGRRNLFDNGQLAVFQRGAAVAGIGAFVFVADRWALYNNAVGTINTGYATTAVFGAAPAANRPRPANIQWLSVGVIDAAPAAGDYLIIVQSVEGQNVQHLNWGTAQAQPVTFSFDCYSTVAGTYIAELTRGASGRSISKAFNHPGGGFATFSLTFLGDTAGGVAPNSTTAEVIAQFYVAAGSTYSGGASLQTDWGTTTNKRAVGITNNWPGTVNNLFAVTNLQLELGSFASPYEVRSYEQDLAACQRYFQRFVTDNRNAGGGQCFSATEAMVNLFFSVSMRANPTLTLMPGTVVGNYIVWQANTAGSALTALVIWSVDNVHSVTVRCTTAGGLVAGNATQLLSAVASTGLDFSADI